MTAAIAATVVKASLPTTAVSPSTSPPVQVLEVPQSTSPRPQHSGAPGALPKPLRPDEFTASDVVMSSSSPAVSRTPSLETSPGHPATDAAHHKKHLDDGRPRRLKSAMDLRTNNEKPPIGARHASFSVSSTHQSGGRLTAAHDDVGYPQQQVSSSSTSLRTGPSTVSQMIICPRSRYVRQARIGRGAYKEVFRAMDEEEGIEVAWSEIDFSQCISKSKVLQEVELLKRLDHPNIIGCFSSWEDSPRRCVVFVSELMTSGTLSEFIGQQSRKRLKRHAIERYGAQILRGLEHLHAHDVIHRDLKCHNVFINGSKGEVKIGDLGVSIASRQATSVIGTPEYMAPEMFSEHYTNAVDVWSFGLCLLEMSTGSRPYAECTNIGQIYTKVSNGVLPNLDEVEDDDVRLVIRDCLAFLPNHRPTAAQLLEHPLFALQQRGGGSVPASQVQVMPQRRVSDADDIASCVAGLAATTSTQAEGSSPVEREEASLRDSVDPNPNDAKSPSSGPGVDNDSVAAESSSAAGLPFLLPPARPMEFSVSDRLQLLEWLRSAPLPVAGEILQFALRRLWIDAMDVENISHTSNSVSRAGSTVAAGWGSSTAAVQQQQVPFSSSSVGASTTAPNPQQFSSRASSSSGVGVAAQAQPASLPSDATLNKAAQRSSPLVVNPSFSAASFRGAEVMEAQQYQVAPTSTYHDPLSRELFQQPFASTVVGSSPQPLLSHGPTSLASTPPTTVSAAQPVLSAQSGSPNPLKPAQLNITANHDIPSANLLLFIEHDAATHVTATNAVDTLASPSSFSAHAQPTTDLLLLSPSSSAAGKQSQSGKPPLPPPAVSAHGHNSGTLATSHFPLTPQAVSSSFEASTASHSSSHQPLSSPSSLSTTMSNVAPDSVPLTHTAAESDRRKKVAAESVQKLMAQFQMFSGPPPPPAIQQVTSSGVGGSSAASPMLHNDGINTAAGGGSTSRSTTPPGGPLSKGASLPYSQGPASGGGSFGGLLDDVIGGGLSSVASVGVDSLFGSPARDDKSREDSAGAAASSTTHGGPVLGEGDNHKHFHSNINNEGRPSFEDITSAISCAQLVPSFGE